MAQPTTDQWWVDYPWRMIQTNLREIDMADMDAERYAQDLQDFGATVVTLNSAGILASYETAHPFHAKSSYLTADGLEAVIDACHRKGIRVIARTDFSKVHYDLYEQYPDWAYRTSAGEIMNYNGDVQVCPNGDYQQNVMFEILKEVLTEFPFDGVFCNMSGFLVTDYSGRYYGPCHCENCMRLFREQYGFEVPMKDDFTDPVYLKYVQFKAGVTARHKEKMRKLVKEIRPSLCMNSVDYIRSESNAEIDRQEWIYSASSNSRLAAGRDRKRPSDNASVDFMGFRYRDISVSPELMALRSWQNLANSNSLSLYIMGRLDNHADTSSFAPTKEVFRFHRQHEEVYAGLKSASEVCVFRRGKWQRTAPETAGWILALTECHIPFDELSLDELNPAVPLSEWKVLILTDARGLSREQSQLMNDYVERGGTILTWGPADLSCLGIQEGKNIHRKCMSSMFMIRPEEAVVFPRCEKTPYIAPGEEIYEVVPSETAHTYLRLIGEHPFGPPERCYFTEKDMLDAPGLVVNSFGKGRTFYLSFGVSSMYRKEGYRNSLNFMQDLLLEHVGVRSISPGSTAMFEVTLTHKDHCRVVQLVNTSGIYDNSCFAPIPIEDIRIDLTACGIEPESLRGIQTLRGGNIRREGQELALERLNDYEAIVLKI